MKFSLPLLGALLESGCNGMFSSAVVEFRTGSPPASPEDATQGSLIGSITIGSSIFGSHTNGVVDISSTWSGTADSGGTVGWFRIKESTDTNASSTTAKRIDGTVGTSDADIVLDTVSLSFGDPITVTNFYLSIDSQLMTMSASGTAA